MNLTRIVREGTSLVSSPSLILRLSRLAEIILYGDSKFFITFSTSEMSAGTFLMRPVLIIQNAGMNATRLFSFRIGWLIVALAASIFLKDAATMRHP